MRAYITEQDIKKMVTECVKLLTEDIISKNMNRARRYLESKGVNTHEERQKIITDVREAVPNVRLLNCKFLLGVTRMYYDGELEGRVTQQLNQTLSLLAGAHAEEYDYNLNGENAQTIINRFKGAVADTLEAEKEKSNAIERKRNEDYTIIPINTPEEAAKYGRYTEWCVTHYSNMYNSYTNNGIGRFYFCLRKGFEQEPEVQGNGCPLDSYGLSMIAVSVNFDGSVNTITCRWNHDNGGNDHIMSVKQLEDVLGVNFYKTFKPYSREELHAKGVIFFDEVQGLLDSGKDPKEIFDLISSFSDGFARVCLNDKFNFLNAEWKLLSDTWFDGTSNFCDGFAWVRLNGKWNFINTEGKIISDKWFDGTSNFCDGFARVKLNGKYNFINTEGKFISDTWFDLTTNFSGRVAKIKLDGKWNYINTKGKLFSDKWFDGVEDFYNEFARVRLNGKWNFINTEGKIISDTWFDNVWDFYGGFARVRLYGKDYKLDKKGKLHEQ